ncbi:unnamed protein product, partial [Allacma fusca]
MRTSTLFTCILVLALLSLGVADPQFGYSRNWFALALRSIPFDHKGLPCLPDDSYCERLTDCCSNWCAPWIPIPRCQPSRCGCPQPPWTPEPIAEVCIPYGESCPTEVHHTCCTGYCALRHN